MIKFDPEMSPLRSVIDWPSSPASSFEIDGMLKIQPMASVEEKVLRSLGWTNLDYYIKERSLRTHQYAEYLVGLTQTQMYYEFGIFSMMYEGKEMPDWISCRSKGRLISFTIPLSPNNLRGLNFCYIVETVPCWANEYFSLTLPIIQISNDRKKLIWIYRHCIEGVKLLGKSCLCLLSHWMFTPNEMKGGDHITIGVGEERDYQQMKAGTIIVNEYGQREEVKQRTSQVMECGIGLVYDDDGMIEEEEGALGYYKSWNHIIGGDLSDFQSSTGQYILNNRQFRRNCSGPYIEYTPFVGNTATYKGNFFLLIRFGKVLRFVTLYTYIIFSFLQKTEWPLKHSHKRSLVAHHTCSSKRLNKTGCMPFIISGPATKFQSLAIASAQVDMSCVK
ncbi:hypothetical protein HanHA300_Chr01g0023891 [Helianthus annuus]|nr:hypothetical protein HanHA300_Chr01g0023881 [Helianthus annuus]KAJ0612152.1 hypothetical protein HanHA300_Chr01g0023891 [Helianthus annuus]